MIDPNVMNLVNIKVLPKFPNDKKQIAISMIVDIASILIAIFQQCPKIKEKLQNNETQTMKTFNNPGLIENARLHMAVRRHIRKNNLSLDPSVIVNAIKSAAPSATREDILLLSSAKLADSNS